MAAPKSNDGGDAPKGLDLWGIEEKWQAWWKENGVYKFDWASTKPVYSFDVPPPYASGALHCGHAVHYTHQDFVARYKRMRGHNVFFPLCFDVNGIPIEERVERELKITRKDIGRKEFIEICSRFADKNIENMAFQFRRLGESLDDSLFYRTDAKEYRRVTQMTFLEHHAKGLIYKGTFPINWCPRCMTAMADAEVEYQPKQTKLNFVKFRLVGEPIPGLEKKPHCGRDEKGQYVLIATTRPELMCACQVVALHPDDARGKLLKGRTLELPVFARRAPVILDEDVVPEFGTGVLMVCSIGDKDDLKKIFKHKLKLEIAIDEEGRLNAMGGKHKGEKVADARAKVIEEMLASGDIVKQQPLGQNVGACWRCKHAIEWIQNPQWFLKILPFKELVLDASKSMDWHPAFMEVRLQDWVNSLEWDWVVSRQRYFATPVPVWECPKGHVVTPPYDPKHPETFEYCDPTAQAPPVKDCPQCHGPLKGSDDVFDTWMDSSISPLFNSHWQRDAARHARLYPMSVRPQSHDIIRTWAYYTILRCTLVKEVPPFREVMMGGFILAEDGTPMHKSKGNVVDPLDVIKKYGAEPLRYYATTCSLGEDNAIRFKDITHGSRFVNKVYNIENFIGGILEKAGGGRPSLVEHDLRPADKWILTAFADTVAKVADSMEAFLYAPAMRAIEEFAWRQFADHYIELVKARAHGTGPGGEAARATLYEVGKGIALLLAPFFPHITEEVWHKLFAKHEDITTIHHAPWPQPAYHWEAAVPAGEAVRDVVAAVRNWKSEHGLALNAPVELVEIVSPTRAAALQAGLEDLKGATGAKRVEIVAKSPDLAERVIAVKPVHAKIGPAFKQDAKAVVQALATADPESLAADLEKRRPIVLAVGGGREVTLEPDFVEVQKGYTIAGKQVDVLHVGDIVVAVQR